MLVFVTKYKYKRDASKNAPLLVINSFMNKLVHKSEEMSVIIY